MARDVFGRLIKRDILGNKISKKEIQRDVIAENRRKGRAAEQNYVITKKLQGYEVERTGRGHDYKLYNRNMFTGERSFVGYREIKSSDTAPLSKLQKKQRKRLGSKYKVVRQDPGFFY
jgi:hypothetical protein